MLRRKTLCCVLSFSEYEMNIKRREGSVVQTQMGKKTEISKLFMVRGGTLKMMPSRSPQTFLKLLSLISVRYSQMRSRCQFQTRVLTGSSRCQASSTKVWRVTWRIPFCSADSGTAASLRSFVSFGASAEVGLGLPPLVNSGAERGVDFE